MGATKQRQRENNGIPHPTLSTEDSLSLPYLAPLATTAAAAVEATFGNCVGSVYFWLLQRSRQFLLAKLYYTFDYFILCGFILHSTFCCTHVRTFKIYTIFQQKKKKPNCFVRYPLGRVLYVDAALFMASCHVRVYLGL